MEHVFRQPVTEDASTMAALASRCQADPRFHIPYVGMSADSIENDIRDVPSWTERSLLAERDGELVGLLIAEVDDEMGRLWWWGPFLDATEDDRWSALADELHGKVRALIPAAVAEEEACADAVSGPMRDWSARHDLVPETASVLLRRTPSPAVSDPRVRPLAAADHEVVMALHSLAFPGTHATPEALVNSAHPRLVIDADSGYGVGRTVVGGYVAYERQSDGSGYVDFLAVAPELRSQGLGAALVDTACHAMFDDGMSYAHLTVREDNAPARALYGRLGFTEDRIVRPYRLGFQIG